MAISARMTGGRRDGWRRGKLSFMHVSSRLTFIPSMATANSFQMPKVFIIPPEEDHSPSWCYFDAAKRGLNRFSQVDSFDSALFSLSANNSAASKNGSSDNVILGALDHHASLCVENDIDYDCEAELLFEEGWDFSDQSLQESHLPQCALPYGYEEPGNDSDVTEVIKIGRHGRGEEELAYMGQAGRSTSVTRSKTLKSHASRVFHSLKKVGRRKSFKLPPVRGNVVAPQANFASSSLSEISQTKMFDAPQTLTLPGRSSILASQLFTPPPGFRSRPSVSHAEEHVNPLVPHSSALSEGPKSRASLSSQDSARSDKPTLACRAASPSPSFLNKSHFSKLNIQKLFSFTTTSSSVCTTSSTISGGLTLSSNDDIVPMPPLPPSCSDQEGTDYMEDLDRIVSHSMGTAADFRPLGRTDSPAKVDVDQKQPNNLACNELDSFSTELSLGLGSDLNLKLGLELGLPSTICKVNDASLHGPHWNSSNENERKKSLNDINFGMHLDSLHFDELSFDVNKF